MEFRVSELMKENSLVSKGDTTRIINAINKAKKGEDITVAFLGGSITQGCNATSFENCYATRTYEWFKNKFSNVNVKYVNAGVGATGSVIGVHRVERQIISEKPDIVFIDFAVNDKDSIYDKIGYESLIRKLLRCENPPAIIEVFMSNFDGSNVQQQQIEIGKKYNLPMISFRDTIYAEMTEERLKWEDVASDEVHPNDYGHFIISELLTDFIEKVCEKEEESKVIELEVGNPIFDDKYINGVIKNNKNIELKEIRGFDIDNDGFQVFQDGWKFISTKGEEASLKVELEGKNIFLLFKKIVKPSAAKLNVVIDNDKKIIVDTAFDFGWGDYSATEILVEDNVSKRHIIEVSVIPTTEENEAYIMGFLVS